MARVNYAALAGTDRRVDDLRLAAAIVRRERAAYAAYRESCDADWRQGYRPHYCRHGMNLWTDYDPICGACEDGRGYWDYLAECRDALDTVARARTEMERRMDEVVRPLFRELAEDKKLMHTPVWDAGWTICDWAMKPIADLKKELGIDA